MITGELKTRVDRIWDTMWSGGISNPLSVIEQVTCLLFIKRLDELHTLKEHKAARTGQPIDDPVSRPIRTISAGLHAHLVWGNSSASYAEVSVMKLHTLFSSIMDWKEHSVLIRR